MLSIVAISFLIFSCSNDDNNARNPNLVEAESAWMIGYRSDTPQGRIYYMEVGENIPSETNVSNAVELGLNARIYSFGDSPFTWNGDAGTITKWEVDRTTLELSVEGLVSFASIGITGNRTEPIFVSETEAYMENLQEGVVVQWNPSTMEITDVFNVVVPPELPNGTGQYLVSAFVTYDSNNNNIIYSLDYLPSSCCEYLGPDGVVIGVFNTETKSLEYKLDNRLISSRVNIQNEEGDIYIAPAVGSVYMEEYFNANGSDLSGGLTVLRLNANGDFDPNFSFDLRSVLPVEVANGFSVIFNDKIVFSYVDSNETQLPDSYDDRSAIFQADFISVAVDLETGEVLPFDAFDGFNYSAFTHTTDGIKYIVGGTFGGDQPEESSILRQNGFNDFTVVSSHVGGSMLRVGRLW